MDKLRTAFQDDALSMGRLAGVGVGKICKALQMAYEQHKIVYGSFKDSPEYGRKMKERYVFMHEQVMDFVDAECNHELMARIKEKGYRPLDSIFNADFLDSELVHRILKEHESARTFFLPGTLLRKENLIPLDPVQIVYGQVSDVQTVDEGVMILCQNVRTGKRELKTLF